MMPICVCLGANNPYYLSFLSLPALCGVYQGAKPNIYHDPKDNQKPRVHDYDEENDHRAICYLDDQNAPFENIEH